MQGTHAVAYSWTARVAEVEARAAVIQPSPGDRSHSARPIRQGIMKIKLTTVHVSDQDQALRFYTEVLGFTKKADFSQGPFRWLTVTSPDDPDGCELQLALADDPAAKAYQQARFAQQQPAIMLSLIHI